MNIVKTLQIVEGYSVPQYTIQCGKALIEVVIRHESDNPYAVVVYAGGIRLVVWKEDFTLPILDAIEMAREHFKQTNISINPHRRDVELLSKLENEFMEERKAEE